MTPAASPRAPKPAAGYLSIGQVLARLTPEFPLLSASKLRFLEVQGIVTPIRTESGYRKFSPADVERLRAALTLQRDHDFKLARIREYLDAKGADADLVVPRSILDAPRRYRRDELLAAAGAAPVLLSDAVSAGLIAPGEAYDERTLALLRTLVALDAHGIQPRHLRSVRQAAERDVDLVENALATLRRRTDAASRARHDELAPELVRRLDELRAGFVQAALERMRS